MGSRIGRPAPVEAEETGNPRMTISNKMKKPKTERTMSTLKRNFKVVDKKLAKIVMHEIVQTESGVSFDDIAGQELAKQELKENVTLAVLRPELFTGLRTPAQRIVLIGPEGNGKTMLAKAVAKESKATFFNICGSSLPSGNLSDVKKFVEVLFAVAQDMQPSIIFFEFTSDESNVSFYELLDILREVQRRVDDRVIVMAAHSSSFLDPTLNRGFEKVIFVDMLAEEGRLQLLQNLLGNHGNSLSQEDLNHIAKITEGYSGRDLTLLTKDAAYGAIRELGIEQAMKLEVSEMRSIKRGDFEDSLKRVKPSVSTRDLEARAHLRNEVLGDDRVVCDSDLCGGEGDTTNVSEKMELVI